MRLELFPRKSLPVDPDALFRELLERTRDGFTVPSLMVAAERENWTAAKISAMTARCNMA